MFFLTPRTRRRLPECMGLYIFAVSLLIRFSWIRQSIMKQRIDEGFNEKRTDTD
jgi:hypothetical protein